MSAARYDTGGRGKKVCATHTEKWKKTTKDGKASAT
jgi:hypothetical protein